MLPSLRDNDVHSPPKIAITPPVGAILSSATVSSEIGGGGDCNHSSQCHVRTTNPGDYERLRAFFKSLSAPSRCNRFLSAVTEVSSGIIELFAQADQKNHVALVATHSHGDNEIIVAEARFIVDNQNPTSAEFAVTVADSWQGQGLGRHLMTLIERIADSHGLRSLWGDTVPTNRALLGLADQCGFNRRRHPYDFRLSRVEKSIGA